MDNTKNACTLCHPACPDALGFPSSCELEQLYANSRTLSKGEHEKNIKFLGLQEQVRSIDNTLAWLEGYTE